MFYGLESNSDISPLTLPEYRGLSNDLSIGTGIGGRPGPVTVTHSTAPTIQLNSVSVINHSQYRGISGVMANLMQTPVIN